MYRQSSKGNPYHDARGRFARKDGMGLDDQTAEQMKLLVKKNGVIVEDKRTTMWASFGEQADVSKMSASKASSLDSKKTKTATTDGRRFYHKQSIQREEYAKSVARFTVPKGTPRADTVRLNQEAYANFRRENAPAIKNGAKIYVLKLGNTTCYQVVESDRIASHTANKRSSDRRNTSTSMKQFSGYTVEFYKNNEVRSCRQGATIQEVKHHIGAFCQKYRKKLSDVDVCITTWRDEKGRVRYMPSYHFANKEDAENFAKSQKNATIINNDDGRQA